MIARHLILGAVNAITRWPLLHAHAISFYQAVAAHRPWMDRHPFDLGLRLDTSGLIPAWLLAGARSAGREAKPYAGCHPGVVRRALETVPDLPRFAFLDAGCGKGRALITASEYPLRSLVGVELAGGLVAIARRNAKAIREAFPERTPIKVMRDDAAVAPLPAGPLVVFCYHAFGEEVLRDLVRRLEDKAAAGDEVFFAYENPVNFAVLDQSPLFRRWSAERLACPSEERGLTTDDEENLVIWRAGGPDRGPLPGAERGLVTTTPGWRVEFG